MDADERSLLEGVLAPRTSGEVPSSRPPPPVALGSTDAPRSRTAVPPVAGSSGTDAGGGGGSGGGGHPRASAGPRSLQPSLWAAVTAGWQPSLRMDLAASAAITASQAMVLAAQWGRARLDERLQPGLVLTGFCLTTYLIACWPTLYWRNRWAGFGPRAGHARACAPLGSAGGRGRCRPRAACLIDLFKSRAGTLQDLGVAPPARHVDCAVPLHSSHRSERRWRRQCPGQGAWVTGGTSRRHAGQLAV